MFSPCGTLLWSILACPPRLVCFPSAPRIWQAGSSHPVWPPHHQEEEVACDPSDATSKKRTLPRCVWQDPFGLGWSPLSVVLVFSPRWLERVRPFRRTCWSIWPLSWSLGSKPPTLLPTRLPSRPVTAATTRGTRSSSQSQVQRHALLMWCHYFTKSRKRLK